MEDKELRSRIVSIVESEAQKSKRSFKAVWNELYSGYFYIYDVQTSPERFHLDYFQSKKKLDKLFFVAQTIYVKNYKFNDIRNAILDKKVKEGRKRFEEECAKNLKRLNEEDHELNY